MAIFITSNTREIDRDQDLRYVPQAMPELRTLLMPIATTERAPAIPRTEGGVISMIKGDAIDTITK